MLFASSKRGGRGPRVGQLRRTKSLLTPPFRVRRQNTLFSTAARDPSRPWDVAQTPMAGLPKTRSATVTFVLRNFRGQGKAVGLRPAQKTNDATRTPFAAEERSQASCKAHQSARVAAARALALENGHWRSSPSSFPTAAGNFIQAQPRPTRSFRSRSKSSVAIAGRARNKLHRQSCRTLLQHAHNHPNLSRGLHVRAAARLQIRAFNLDSPQKAPRFHSSHNTDAQLLSRFRIAPLLGDPRKIACSTLAALCRSMIPRRLGTVKTMCPISFARC